MVYTGYQHKLVLWASFGKEAREYNVATNTTIYATFDR